MEYKNTPKNQALSNTTAPDYEQGYLDSLNRPTYPTKPRFIPTLDAFDILNRASGEWYTIAAGCGIDGQKLHSLINRNQTIYKRGIELDKSYRGKVMAWVQFKTAKSGQEYVTITFKTFKHGEVKATFNGWEWLENNGYVGKKDTVARPSSATVADDRGEFRISCKLSPAAIAAGMEVIETPAPTPKAEPAKLTPVKVCTSCGQHFTPKFSSFTECPDCYSYEGKLKRYQETKALYDSLPSWISFALDISFVLVKSYLGKKGYLIADIQATGLDIRRGQDSRGSFIIFALRNIEGKITGYQKIYDAKFTGYDGELRDKDFCFYPNKATGKTLKQGSFAVLGDMANAENGLMFVEGLATGISVFLATGLTVIVCLDAGNLDAAMANFSEYTKKYIAADFDYNQTDTGNVGIYSALQAAKKHKARVFVPILKDDKGNFLKCDFDDLRQAKGLDAVKYQLKLRNNPNEVKPTNETLFKYCPEKQLKNLALSRCYESTKGIYSRATLRTKSNELQRLFDDRGFTEFKARRAMLDILRNGVIETVIKNNCFNGHHLVQRIDIKGLSNEQIAAKIKDLTGIVIDNRQLGTGKTELMALLKTILEKTVSFTKEPIITDAERKAYFLQSGGVNIIDWQRITANQKDFSIWKALNEEAIKTWLNHPPVRQKPFCTVAIAHRISLIDSLSTRLNLAHYAHVESYDTPNSAICLPSIPKFESLEPDFLPIDEFRQNLEFLHDSKKGLIKNPLEVEQRLIEWINSAGLVMASDADFNQASLDWLLTNCPSMPIYWLDSGKPKQNGKTIHRISGGDAIEKLITRAIDTVKQDKTAFLAFDSANQARRAYEEIIKQTGINEDLVLLLTDDTQGEPRQTAFKVNPDSESKNYQVIIHSPVISSGVSILQSFDFVGAGFYGVIPPNELLQMIARLRKANNIYVAIVPSNNHDRPTDINDLIKGHDIQLSRINAAGKRELSSFDTYRLNLMATRNAALNDFERQFLILVQLKGYRVKEAELTDLEQLAIENNETVKTEISTKDVKELVCSEIYVESDLSDFDAEKLENRKDRLTQSEKYQLQKYYAKKMAGKQSQELNTEDIHFSKYEDGLEKVQNLEQLLDPDIEKAKANDLVTHETRQKLPSKTGKLLFFFTVISQLEGKPVKRALIQQCLDFLHENHEEVAINGLGNFKRKTSDTRKLNAFLEKCGYALVETDKETTGTRERIYTLQVNEQVKTYADNRKRIRQELLELEFEEF
jgi:hypothetical protein